MKNKIMILTVGIFLILLVIVVSGITFLSKKNSHGYHGAGALHEYLWVCKNCNHKNMAVAPEPGPFVCEACGTALEDWECLGETDNHIVTGGQTDYSDPNAPKEIKSKKIVSFYTHFYAFDMEREDSATGEHDIQIKDNEKGEHVLTISGVYNFERIVDNSVFTDVQEIIDQYDLVKKNGEGYVTAGLAPECQPWELSVIYDSGEKLYFYENGSPNADWTVALREYFIDIMNSKEEVRQ